MTPAQIVDKILPEKKDNMFICSWLQNRRESDAYIDGYNTNSKESRQRLLDTYGKEWVGVPSVETLEKIIITKDDENKKSGHRKQWFSTYQDIAESILKGLNKKGE